MRIALLLLGLFLGLSASSQTLISGIVIDIKKGPVLGANVYLEGTYDGATTNEKGEFSFETLESGTLTLVVSFVSYVDFRSTQDVTAFRNLSIVLREDVNTLDAVSLNTGTFEAGEESRVTALKPLDIVTTANAVGDFVGALQTLPGTSTVAEDGRLFVRGGEAEESQIFIDGIRVFAPFTPTTSNIPTRGRFSPFLFKGISFSTGGYSAEFGQALSGVLQLNTIDEPDQEITDIAVMSVGVGVGNTQKWNKGSFSINTSYINLSPYLAIAPDRNEWINPIQSLSGEMVYRYKVNSSDLFKLYGAYSYTNLDLIQQNINFEDGFRFGNENTNLYINGSYKSFLGSGWIFSTGFSLSNDNNDMRIGEEDIENNDSSAHFKAKMRKRINNRVEFNFGGEYFLTNFDEEFESNLAGNFEYGFNNNISAAFTEVDFFFSKRLAAKAGLRVDHYELFNETKLSPRASVAYKIGDHSQVSLAYGEFYQNPNYNFLKFEPHLRPENASHFIANFQFVKPQQIFRVEAYLKDYSSLVRFDTENPTFLSDYNNTGFGYANGIDVFWRDNKTLKHTDYWISYSYLDTERLYRNYPTEATPNFASAHNLSVVAKYWVEDWQSQFGFSYQFATGRTYSDPNLGGFLNQETRNFRSLSLNWAYLITQQKILYFSINNVLGTRNVFGYNYANQPDMNGVFQRESIVPNDDQFFFVGLFWTISDDKKSNQLDNL